jgi:hypothetical protein
MAASKEDAPFVFEGSVKSLTASNVAGVPADTRTVVVQVDHVRHAPRAMAGFAGQHVTVRLAPGESLRAGERRCSSPTAWFSAITSRCNRSATIR